MSKTPLCDQLTDHIPYETTVAILREQQEYGAAFIGHSMLLRLNDRQSLINFINRAGLMSSNGAEFADHIRAYVLSGRTPWK